MCSSDLLALIAARLPYPTAWALPEPRAEMGAARRCAAALSVPDAPVRLLHWRLEGGETAEEIRGTVATARPDVAVLFGADAAAAEAAAGVVGGEHRTWEEGAPISVIAAGGFHACGDADEWRDPGTPGAVTLTFVGATPETIFPLTVARLPGPFAADAPEARRRLAEMLAAVGSTGTIAVADTVAPTTFRMLDRGLLDLGMVAVPTPPGWPHGLWPIPALHPDVRVWTGKDWRMEDQVHVESPLGAGPPVVTVLRGPERGQG